jgi:Protein of unknown function (DUF3098)
MSTIKKPASDKKVLEVQNAPGMFEKANLLWMVIGLVVIAIGMFLMAGGKSADPNQFLKDEVYSTRRITIAPILILIGLGIEIFAIFKKPAAQSN